jgi:hypothetical protein
LLALAEALQADPITGSERTYSDAKIKRLERGTFQRPRRLPSGVQVEMDATDLALLLSGIELTSVKRRPRYSLDSAKHTRLESIGS